MTHLSLNRTTPLNQKMYRTHTVVLAECVIRIQYYIDAALHPALNRQNRTLFPHQ
jgi:hypothetical protein